MRFLSVFLAIAGLGFAAEAMGLFAHELNTAAAVALLLLSAALDPALKKPTRPAGRGALAAAVAIAVLGLILIPAALTTRFFAIALWFWGLDRVRVLRGGPDGSALGLSLACLVFGLYTVTVRSSLLGWYVLHGVSGAISSTGSALSGEPLDVGPTFNGLDGFLLCALACLGSWWSVSFQRPRRYALAGAGIVVTYLLYLVLFAQTPAWLPAADQIGVTTDITVTSVMDEVRDMGWTVYPAAMLSKLFPLHMSWMAVLLPGLFVAGCLRREVSARHPQRWVPGTALLAPCAALLAVWCLTNVPAGPRGPRMQVALFEKGFLNWVSPTHRTYGSRSAGMFGNMPLLMESMGWSSQKIATIDQNTLADKDILVVINQKDPLPNESLDAIDDFVEQGGSLLVLGDHTFAKDGGKMWINQPLGTTDIGFKFDSADYFIGGWLHSLQYAPSQMTATLGDATNEAGCVVGASLDVSYPAAPIVMGRYGYSDAGEWEASNRGYLGDMNPNANEQLGDVVLVAAQNVGHGRVVVVGDTSGFVNAIQTQTWPFVVRAFRWLASSGRAAIPAWRDGLGLTLLLLLGVGVLWACRNHAVAIPSAACGLLLATLLSTWVVNRVHAPQPLAGNVAVVDLSHVGLHSLEGWRETAINGVYLNLMREGFLSFGLHDFDSEQIEESKVFVTIAPTMPYSSSELEVLESYMKQGGTVVLSVGYEERAGAQTMLDHFGLEVLHRPLGRFPGPAPNGTVQATMWKGWAVRGGQPLVNVHEEPTITHKKIGSGHLILIGDSNYLLNKNLEVEEGAILGNVRFLQWLLNDHLGVKAS